jgi:hypothetical protein
MQKLNLIQYIQNIHFIYSHILYIFKYIYIYIYIYSKNEALKQTKTPTKFNTTITKDRHERNTQLKVVCLYVCVLIYICVST